jgi:hypothetical protein
MPIFLIAVVAIIVIVVAGIFLAKGTAVFDQTVQQNRGEMDKKASTGNGYNMALTMGYKISASADYETQVREARKLSAKRAAALPRGANNGIGRLGAADELKTAWQGVEHDPVTAVKIAAHHGWDGLRTGYVVAPVAAATPTTASAPAAADVELVPGKDYSVIEITDDMSPADIRKARIANAKAKSAAKKAAKADGVTAAATAPAGVAPVAAAPAPAAVNIPEPEMIEITDDMTPDEVRKARIANSKAKSAYKKALKAAGVDAQAAAAPAAAPVPAAVTAPEPAAANVPPPPELIEITDDMDPAAVRQARIANSKAKSAYKKALKAAGIDPQSVNI